MPMTVRCDKCGRNTAVETSTGSVTRCEHCGHEFDVPVALASLPRPKVPSAARPATSLPVDANPPAATAAPAEGAPAEETEDGARDGRAAEVVSRSMPWVLSLLIHAGIVLLMSFVVLIAQAKLEPDEIIFPSAEFSGDPGGVLNPGMQNPNLQAAQPAPTPQKDWSRVESQIPLASSSQQNRRLEIFGVGAGGSAGGSLARTGMLGGSGAGPRAAFYGTGGNAHHVVFVIDRSGSMFGLPFDLVRAEMLRSIGLLTEEQDFHMVFFNDGDPIESPPRRLVPAVVPSGDERVRGRNKAEAAEFLAGIQATSAELGTYSLPAMRRAFQVLQSADPRRKGKLIYLLTDGELEDGRELIEALGELNRNGDVQVNTYLYLHDSEQAKRTLQEIADRTGGQFRFIGESNQ